jgi:nicotinamidase-related amidase
MFRHRAEETGIIKVQARLLERFRTDKAKVVYTLVTYQPGFLGVRPNSPLFRTAIAANTLLDGTPAVEVIDELAPGPMNRSSGDRRPTGSTAPYSTPLSALQASTPSNPPRGACDLGYRTIVVSDACTADSDEAHARSLGVLQKWLGETPTADEVLSALG